jgi:hypothetical protein
VSRIFLGNFDFEHELAGFGATGALPHFGPGRTAAPTGWDRDWAWVAIAQPGDVVLTKSEIDSADFSHLADMGLPIPRFVDPSEESIRLSDARLEPWGWTPTVREFGKERGWRCDGPPSDVVRQVNSRVFRCEMERESDTGLAGLEIVSSLDDLETIVSRQGSAPCGWLLKANYGMSGREARRGRGSRLEVNIRNWARRRLQFAGPIIFEPIVERVAEAGIQIEIPKTGEPMLVGVTPLLVDKSSVYRGSRFATPAGEAELWQSAVETGLRLANRLQALGYFGPLGIDAMQYRDEAGQIRLRPIQDLNARYTMGRLALGFRRILPAGWFGSWLHFGVQNLAGRAIAKRFDEIQNSMPRESRVLMASPRQIGSQSPAGQAVVVIAPTIEILAQAEAAVFSSLAITIVRG